MRKILLSLACLFLCAPAEAFNLVSAAKNEQGNRLYKKGQVAKARKTYESALKSDPKSPEIAFNLGNAYYKEQTFGESLKRYNDASLAEKEPLFRSRAFYNLGNAFYRAGQTDKAAESYKQALRLNPKDQDAKYNLELVNKRKREEDKKKDDPKKDEQKKDDKKDQNQQNQGGSGQKDQQQGGGGSGQDQEKQGGQGGEQDKGQDPNQQQKDQQEQPGQSNQGQDSQDQKNGTSSGAGNKDDSENKEGSGQEGQSAGEQDAAAREAREREERQAQEVEARSGAESGGSDEQEPKDLQEQAAAAAEPVKTDAERRAEQILAALQGQEQQVFRQQTDGQRRRARAQRLMEKDW